MLSFTTATTTSGGGSRRHYRPSRGDAWRRRNPAVPTTSLDFKRHQLVAAQRQPFESDAQQLGEVLLDPPTPPRRRIRTAFRLMTFGDSDNDDESDYVPSEIDYDEEMSEEEGDEASGEEHFEQYQEKGEAAESDEQQEEVLYDDSRWWKSNEDKRRWEKHYRHADAAFRKRFGCAIDTPAHPETRRWLRKEKVRHRAYTFVLAGLVIAYLAQLAVVYSASSWAFSMVTWRSTTTENSIISDNGVDKLADISSNGHSDPVSNPTALSSQQQVPEHVRTGLHLCSTLSRRVVKSEHDVTATQHALRACDIAVKFAPLQSREAIEAHVLRGDLRSLLSHFDGADEDYKAAMALVLLLESGGMKSKLSRGLSQDLDLKLVANRWTQLYRTKNYKELRREAKARVAQAAASVDNSAANAVSKLAVDWLSAFKRNKPVLDVLTRQRRYTLRRLKYEAFDDDDKSRPDIV